MLGRNKDEKLNVTKINEGVKIGVNLLKICYFLVVVIAIYVSTLLLAKWNVLPFVFDILKVISPLFIGLVIAWLFDPFVTKLQNKGVNRVLGTVFTYVLIILAVVLLGWLTIPAITSQVNDMISATPSFISYLKDGINGIFNTISDISGYDLKDVEMQIYDSLNQLGSSLTVGLPNLIMGIITSIVSGGINLVCGVIVGFYMLFDFSSIRKHFLSMIPVSHKKETEDLIDKLNVNLKSFVHGTLLIMLILFTIQSIGLTIAGMKAPLVFGLFCAIMNIIPYFGPYIGGIPTVLVALSISPMTGILALISVVICQVLESYFLQPIVMGRSMSLHPVTIMLGLLIFQHFFGILGMILATPIIAIGKTILLHFANKYEVFEKLNKNNEAEI